ncbi:AAA family ATPase [Candidatus Margulisiibacteriota bacterium]
MISKFQISQKLIGREKEISELSGIFKSVAEGGNELALVSGYSGIGKTALIQEMRKLISLENGFFLTGKFNQFGGTLPYSAFRQAFNSLIKQILCESEEKLTKWREELQNAVGTNGQILIDIIPELENIIGKQPPIAKLNPTEALARFNILFHSFINVFAKKEHPLIIFIDDLQWSDSGAIKIIESLALSMNIRYFFLICAYRDNEVTKGHLLWHTINEIKGKKEIYDFHIEALNEESVNKIISNTLNSPEVKTKDLGSLVYKKTGGNPFFTSEFLKGLHRDNYLNFNPKAEEWEWNLNDINKAEISSNVVAFMIERVKKLPGKTKNVLQLAACIGNSFDLKTLKMVNQKSFVETTDALWEAVKQEIIIPQQSAYKVVHNIEEKDYKAGTEINIDITYKFQHDRLQQAFHSLLTEERKKEVHLLIGRLLLKKESKKVKEEKIIEIVNHINIGVGLIQGPKEKEDLVQLNLKAVKKAKLATAYQTAWQSIQTAMNLLPKNSWKKQYETAFDVYYEYVECAYLCREIKEGENKVEILLKNVRDKFDYTKVLLMQTIQYCSLEKHELAVRASLKGLAVLGVKMPFKPSKFTIIKEVILAKLYLRKKSIADLINKPIITNPTSAMIIKLCFEVGPIATVIGNQNLTALAILKIFNITIREGLHKQAAGVFAVFGMVEAIQLHNTKRGNEFGQLALKLLEKDPNQVSKETVYFAYSLFVYCWLFDIQGTMKYFEKTVEEGLKVGNVNYVGYASKALIYPWCDINLEIVLENSQKHIALLQEIKALDSWRVSMILYNFMLNLTGNLQPKDKLSLDSSSFREDENMQKIFEQKNISCTTQYYFIKMELAFYYEKYLEGLKYIDEALKILSSQKGQIWLKNFHFFAFLILVNIWPFENKKDNKKYWKVIEDCYKKMKSRAADAPANFLHHQLLMEAEMARCQGKRVEAEELYSQAIEEVNKRGYIRYAGICNELAAKFYLSIGQKQIAAMYMNEAYYNYTRWGAKAKLVQLKEKYSELFGQSFYQKIPAKESIQSETTSLGTTTTTKAKYLLDYETIMKASQAISAEINPEKMVQKIISTINENAGAQRTYLIIKSDNGEMILQGLEIGADLILLKDYKEVSQSIIQYVTRTKKPLVLSDASNDVTYLADPYIKKRAVKSIFCLPIIFQGELRGVIYLENNLVEGAFSEDRINAVKVLGTQAAISLENASFYTKLEHKVEKRTKELKEAKEEAEKANHYKSTFLAQMTHDLRTPLHVVNGVLDLLSRFKEIQKNKEVLKPIDIALKSGERQLNLVNSILDLSKIESGKMEMNMEDFPLNDLFIGIEEQVKTLLHTKPVEFVLENTLEKENLIMRADKTRLGQVITNLLSNATKFTEKGEIRLTVSQGSMVLQFTISDTGIGMSPENCKRVFESYVMVESDLQKKHKGTGLGLSICKGFVEAHNGEIQVESELKKGAKFSFSIPWTKTVAKKAEIEELHKKIEINYEKLKVKKVLMIDDDHFNLEFAKMILEGKLKYELVDSGKKALENTKKEKYDLILLDLNMPEMDGRETFKAIRRQGIDTPIIALTAEAMKGTKEELEKMGFDGYLSKPFKEKELLEFLAKEFGLVK